MEENINIIEPQAQGKPPFRLKLLCILTFIWSGMNLIYNFVYGFFYDWSKTLIINTTFPKEYKEFKEVAIFILSAGRYFFLLGLLLYVGSILGAYFMFKLKKFGFHIYTLSNLLLLMLPMLYFKGEGLNLVSLVITALFIMYYSRFLKLMA
jgi:hypothetical protein